MKILLLEDDCLQAESIRRELERAFGMSCVEELATESQFRARLNTIARDPPDVAVLDVMVRWADPSPEPPEPPEDVRREKFYRAGLRCARLLAAQVPDVPIVLYSILHPDDLKSELPDLSPGVTHLPKKAELRLLVDLIRRKAKR